MVLKNDRKLVSEVVLPLCQGFDNRRVKLKIELPVPWHHLSQEERRIISRGLQHAGQALIDGDVE